MQKITQSQWKFVRASERSTSKHPRAFYECGLCNQIYERQCHPIKSGISKCCVNCSRQINKQCNWLITFYGRGKQPVVVTNLAKWARDNGYPQKEVENKSYGRIKGSVYGIRRIIKLSD